MAWTRTSNNKVVSGSGQAAVVITAAKLASSSPLARTSKAFGK